MDSFETLHQAQSFSMLDSLAILLDIISIGQTQV